MILCKCQSLGGYPKGSCPVACSVDAKILNCLQNKNLILSTTQSARPTYARSIMHTFPRYPCIPAIAAGILVSKFLQITILGRPNRVQQSTFFSRKQVTAPFTIASLGESSILGEGRM